MAEIWDQLKLDTTQAQDSIKALGDRAKAALGDSAKSADRFIGELERLKKAAVLDRAKASSDDYRKALLEQQKAAKALAAVHGEVARELDKVDGKAKRVASSLKNIAGGVAGVGLGAAAGFGAMATAATGAASSMMGLASAGSEWAKAGADASRIAAAFSGDIGKLRTASAGLVDDTTLQRFSILGQKLGLTATEFEGLTARATQLYSQGLGASVAENLEKLANPEIESMKNLGIIIDTTSKKFEGLSDAQRTLMVSQEQAALGNQALADGLDVTGSGVAQAEVAVENLISDLQVWFNDTVEGSGFLEDFKGIIDDVKTAFFENEETIKSLVESGLDLFIGAMKEAISLAKGLKGAMESLDTALNGSGRAFGQRQLGNAAARATIGDIDTTDESAVRARAGQLALSLVSGGNAELALDAGKMLGQAEQFGGLASQRAYTGAADASIANEQAAAAEPKKFVPLGPPAPPKAPKKPRGKKGKKKPKGTTSDGSRLGVIIGGLVGDAVDEGEDFAEYWRRVEEAKALAASIDDLGGKIVGVIGGSAEGWAQSGGLIGAFLGDATAEEQALAAATGHVDSLTRSLEGAADAFGNLAMAFDENASGIEGVIGRLGSSLGAAAEIVSANQEQLAEAMAVVSSGAGDQTGAMKTLATTGLAAGKAFTAGLIKDVRAQAAVMGLFEIAEAAAAYPDPIGMASHAFAATTYFAVAGGAGGGGKKSSGSGGGVAHATNEQQRRTDEGEREARVTVNLHGIPVPDRTARELVDSIDQGLRLRGSRLAA